MRHVQRILSLLICTVLIVGINTAVTANAAVATSAPPTNAAAITPGLADNPQATPYVPSVLYKSQEEIDALMSPDENQDDPEDIDEQDGDAAAELEALLNARQSYHNTLLPGQPAPYTLEVDVVNQVVTAYGLDADGLYTTLARQMICSTGKKNTPTLLGKFIMPGERRDRHDWAFFPEFNVYAQYTSRIYKGYLFHSVLFNKRDEKSLITSSVRNLGRRASHGCIRLQVKDAQWIYENCPPGTVVHVFDDAKRDEELTKRLKAGVASKQTRE